MTAARRHVVVGVDGSKESVQALHWAQLATPLGAELDAVMAWEYPVSYGVSAWGVEWDPSADAATLLEHTLHLAFGDERPTGLKTVVTVVGTPCWASSAPSKWPTITANETRAASTIDSQLIGKMSTRTSLRSRPPRAS